MGLAHLARRSLGSTRRSRSAPRLELRELAHYQKRILFLKDQVRAQGQRCQVRIIHRPVPEDIPQPLDDGDTGVVDVVDDPRLTFTARRYVGAE